jgi:hypothetical protein
LKDWGQVAHACNPSYSGGRDQEDHDLKPAQEIVPSTAKKKKKKKKKSKFIKLF